MLESSVSTLYSIGPQKTMIHPRKKQKNLGWISQSIVIFRLIGGIFQQETNCLIGRVSDVIIDEDMGWLTSL